MSNLPADLEYSAEHEWVRRDGDAAAVGITQFAADALGDVVYVDLPAVGDRVEAGKGMGEIESTKSVSELFAPVTGEVVEVNDAVVDDPALVNSAPFADGWLVRVRVESDGPLMDAAAYERHIAEQGE